MSFWLRLLGKSISQSVSSSSCMHSFEAERNKIPRLKATRQIVAFMVAPTSRRQKSSHLT